MIRTLLGAAGAAALLCTASGAQTPGEPGAEWRAMAEAELQARLNRPVREGRAKNVIVFIADGFGVSTITAARILDGQLRGENGEENYLSFEEWGHSALVKTYAENGGVLFGCESCLSLREKKGLNVCTIASMAPLARNMATATRIATRNGIIRTAT